MHQPTREALDKLAKIIAEVAELPLRDAAFALWLKKHRLDQLEGRWPYSDEQVALFRSMTPEQQAAKYRADRDNACDGPLFGLLKRAFPHTDDAEVRQAITEAVRFEDDYSKYFRWDGDFWDCVVRAVAQAQRKHPDYLDTTHRDARHSLAYYMK